MSLLKPRMAEIIRSRKYARLAASALIVLILVLINRPGYTLYQQDNHGKKKIELLYCDELIIDKQINKNLQRLIGNVALKHNDIYMTCDSAYLYSDINQVKAYGRVKINQGDTLTISGNYLYYDGNEDKALMEGNVELKDKESQLFTPLVNYNAKTKIADYPGTGRIINGDNILTSRIGIYYAEEKIFHFKDSVKIVNPDYTMLADTLNYNTATETAFFTGPTVLEGDSLYLYCEKGWYDTKNNISSIWKNAVIDNRQQQIKGDSLFYDKGKGYGEAYRGISITDTTNSIIVEGNYAWYYKSPEKFLVTDSALFIQVSKGDSLYLHADTIKAITLTCITDTTSYRLLHAYRGCRVFSNDLQAKCDSLAYSFQDSVVRLYYSPVIWSEENQLTADSMAIFTKNRQTERMELYNTVFVASRIDSLRFNQMKGRKLTGFFTNNKLYRILIEGNGETIYYLVDNDQLVGVNHAKSASIEIGLEEGKINYIREIQNPEGNLDPPGKDAPENLRLQGFIWFEKIRPVKKSDVFIKDF